MEVLVPILVLVLVLELSTVRVGVIVEVRIDTCPLNCRWLTLRVVGYVKREHV